ncbi:MAG: chorismate synthase [Candidatus Ancillula sp.]|jgi:chorismate synthase|nr:chorismate synthase [Candidatus Ancillula sp.]
MVNYRTAGESHGKSLISFVEGIPAGVDISADRIADDLSKRRGGIGRGSRQKFEADKFEILSGMIHGKTIASPIAVEIYNSEWEKWTELMSTAALLSPKLNSNSNQISNGINQIQPNMPKGQENDKLQRPRPGHADLEGIRKYGFDSARPVLERSSARETAARVVAGSICQQFLEQAIIKHFGNKFSIDTKVIQFGAVKLNDFSNEKEFFEACENFAETAVKNKETVGGIVEIRANGVPNGLGSYISADSRLDGAIAGAMMSIQAVKGVEIGDGFEIASIPGSEAHDVILANNSKNYFRKTNHAGGIEGGISNGEEIIIRIAIKPIPSVPGGLQTVDLSTGKVATAHPQRSDASAVFPAQCVAKAMLAITLADFWTKRFGQDIL